MNHVTQQLMNAILDPDVAAVAGFSSTDWQNHVFITYDLGQFNYSVNIGRLPLVVVQENENSYDSLATGANETGGLVDIDLTVRIMTNSFQSRMDSNRLLLNNIKTAILKSIPLSFETSKIETLTIKAGPISTYLDIIITANRAYGSEYDEDGV